jgi:Protein of unknown function (DUF3426)
MHAPSLPPPYRDPLPAIAPAPRSRLPRSLAVAVVLLLMVLFAAGGFFAFTDTGKDTARNLVPRVAAFLGGEGAGSVSRYEVKNVIGYYESGAASRRILVIKGQVTNLSSSGRSGIRVAATLLDNADQVVGEQLVYAGNSVSGSRLKTASRTTLEKTLANPLGEHLANMDVLPGKTVPFMVLFFDAPENIESYRLEAKDNE